MVILLSLPAVSRERRPSRAVRRTTACVAALLLLFLFSAQAAAGDIVHAVHTDLKMEIPESPRLGFIRPSIEIYQVSAGGVSEKMQDWCDTACANVRVAVEEVFGEGIKIIPMEQFESGSSLSEEMMEMDGLYDTVTRTISNTWAGPLPFPKKYRRFDYSLGKLDEIFDALGVDALIFVSGYDQVKTGGRQAFEFVAFLAAGAVYSKATYLDVGLVGRSGKLLWYKLMGSLPQTDLRDPEGARAYVDRAFEGFPLK